jgi:hypothetical protein
MSRNSKEGPCCYELVKTQEQYKDFGLKYDTLSSKHAECIKESKDLMAKREDDKKIIDLKYKVYDNAVNMLKKGNKKVKDKANTEIAELKSTIAEYEAQLAEYKKAFDIQSELQKDLQQDLMKKYSRVKSHTKSRGKKSPSKFSGGKRRSKRSRKN